MGQIQEIQRADAAHFARLRGEAAVVAIREARAALLAPYEVDGWRGDPGDLMNGHRRNEDGTHQVTFIRYVKPDGTPEDLS